MTKLYELSKDYIDLQNLAEDETVPIEAIRDTLEGVEGAIQVKAENIGKLCANWDSDIDAVEKQISVLTARKRTLANKKEGLKDYLRENMERAGINKIECPYFIINCVEGRDNAVIDDADKLPDDYVDVVVNQKPDKARITKDLKAGVLIPGAHLETTRSSIRIR